MNFVSAFEWLSMVTGRRRRYAMGSPCKMALSCNPFTSAAVRYVDHIGAAEAQAWLDAA